MLGLKAFVWLLLLVLFVAPTFAESPPVAVIGGPYSVTYLNSMTLDALGSFDPDLGSGDTITAKWDLNNDGAYNDATGLGDTHLGSTELARLWDTHHRSEGHRFIRGQQHCYDNAQHQQSGSRYNMGEAF